MLELSLAHCLIGFVETCLLLLATRTSASPMTTSSQSLQLMFAPNQSTTTNSISTLLGASANTTNASSQSMLHVTTPSGNILRINCNGALYGHDLDVGDCRDAVGWLPRDDGEQRRFAMRGRSGQGLFLPLPARWLGGKYREDMRFSFQLCSRTRHRS